MSESALLSVSLAVTVEFHLDGAAREQFQMVTLGLEVPAEIAEQAVGTFGGEAKDLLGDYITDRITIEQNASVIAVKDSEGEILCSFPREADGIYYRSKSDPEANLPKMFDPFFVADESDLASLQIGNVRYAE